MRTLRYGNLRPLPEHCLDALPKKPSITNAPKAIGFEYQEMVLECSGGAMDHYKEADVEDAKKYISPVIKDKLEADAMKLRYIQGGDSVLPID